MTAARPPQLTLTQIQSRFAKAVMRPLTSRDTIDPLWHDGSSTASVADTIVKPNDRLKSIQRLEIYNRQYWFRIWESLAEDFPGLQRLLGNPRFFKTMTAYVTRHPSQSFTLRNLGRRLPAFLASTRTWSRGLPQNRRAMALQMAAFEWAQVEAFDGPAKPCVTPQDLADKDPATLKLALQPYITLLALDYALDDFTLALKNKGENQPSGSIPKTPAKAAGFLAVHRLDESIYYRRLTPAAYAVLHALSSRVTLEKALNKGQKIAKLSDVDWAPQVQQLFGLWVQLGWLCLPDR